MFIILVTNESDTAIGWWHGRGQGADRKRLSFACVKIRFARDVPALFVSFQVAQFLHGISVIGVAN